MNIGKKSETIFFRVMKLGRSQKNIRRNVSQERLVFLKYTILIASLNDIKERLDGCFEAILVGNMAKVLIYSGKSNGEQLISIHILNE